MKILKKYLPLLLLLLMLLPFLVSADTVYSSQEDPLVSLSYVNDILGPEIMAQVIARIDAEYVKISDLNSVAAGSYTAVSLTKGQTLMARSVCEIVLLEGSANAVVTSSANVAAGAGIHDLTAGNIVINGAPLPAGHYLVVSKPDGRGLTVLSDTAVILIRGEYHIT